MVTVRHNKDISRLNTFGMKVKAACYIEYSKPLDLQKISWDELPQPVLPVGSGSNLLFTSDFKGTVLHSEYKDIEILEERSTRDEVYVRAGSGVVFDRLCHWAAGKGLWGIENLSGIPGTVGASAVQNVGAYGVEAGDVIDTVYCYDIQSGEFVSFSAEQCQFAYRDSFFKHNRGRYIVAEVVFRLSAVFSPQLEYGHLREAVERNIEFVSTVSMPYPQLESLTPATNPGVMTPMLVRDTVRIIREEKLPDPAKVGSAGSFFKNPVVSADKFSEICATACEKQGPGTKVPHYDLADGTVKVPAAWMIEFCGFKGRSKGGAAVWEKQPLVIVNASGKALPQDILELEREIIEKIRLTFGVELHPEVDHI